ncbi:MAG: beta-glucosidase BglX [Bacteroidota bacterium]|jgi:beta-glucosidase
MKRMKRLLSAILLTTLALACSDRQRETGRANEADRKMNAFVDSVLRQMTLKEKIGQLNLVSIGFDVTGPVVSENVEEKIKAGLVGGVFNTYTPIAVKKLQEMAVNETRLGIPLLFGFDVIHGHRTIFPQPLGLAASWDLEAIERSARIAAIEASADGLNWVFSPMVDICRDPRWGRISEGAGEDPYLGSRIAEAMVRGYQGIDLAAPNTVMACVKHFALYGAAEAGRDYNPADMGDRTMYDVYLPPYKAAIDAGAGSVMTSFNEINGVPATASHWLNTELLRKEWGFDGLLVSDYTAIAELIPHGIGDAPTVSSLALQSGVDMDMVSEFYLNNLEMLTEDNRDTETWITTSARRVLEAKYKLGLFDDPYRYVNEELAVRMLLNDEHRNAARDIARKSMVLLKNTGVLPLRKSGSIALVGPLARNQRDMIGNWSGAGDWRQAVSVEQGIRNIAGNAIQIHTAHGANITDDPQLITRLNAHGGELQIDPRPADALIQEAVAAARRADVIVAVVGESQGMSGEAASRADISLPGRQEDLLKALKATGKPLVVILMNGRPLAIPWVDENADAILEAWFPGTEAGNAVADILFGNYNPSGKLPATFPRVVGQIPLYYNHKNTGRPFGGQLEDKYKSRYLDVPNEPLYPFGFGLSYTTFAYENLRLSADEMVQGDTIDVTVTVRNTGSADGEEVIQLYVRDVVGSVTRPVKELKGFRKVAIPAGQAVEVAFKLSTDDLRFHNINMEYVAEPGEFEVMVGGNSRDVISTRLILTE